MCHVLGAYWLHAPSSGILQEYSVLYFSYNSVNCNFKTSDDTKKLENLLSCIEACFSIAFLLSKHLQKILLDFISSEIKIFMLFFLRLLLFWWLIEERGGDLA